VQWLGPLAARWRRLPIVYSRRTDAPEYAVVGRAKYALYDRVIAISSCIHRQLSRVGVPATKLRLVHSGVDPAPAECADRASLCREFALEADAFIVGCVGLFIQRKGHAVLLEAMQQLRDRHPRLRLVLFGSGPLEGDLRRRVAAAGLAPLVRFAGFRPDVRRLLPALDLVVHPALAEGLGVALLEAAVAGVPIVATRAGGIPDLVRHEETGLLVKPGSASQLAAAISRVLDDAVLRRRLGAAAQQLALSQFTRDSMAQGNLAIYREVLAERAARQSTQAA
jgi:glycosyltransferase involved in cell wall biosynthesis